VSINHPIAPPAAPASTTLASAVAKALEQVCLPLLHGQNLKSVAPAAGLKQIDSQWILPIDDKSRLELNPPGLASPHDCSATIFHPASSEDSTLGAINGWAKTQSPPLKPIKTREQTKGAVFMHTTSTWSAKSDKTSENVSFSEEKTLEGRPVDGDHDRSTLLVNLAPS
jgi:hypothetical protein